MIENRRSSAISPGEAVEEKVSQSVRFGLRIGFHACAQDTNQAIVVAYGGADGLKVDRDRLKAGTQEWAITRGVRSGRVACQFIQDLGEQPRQTLD